MGNTVIVGFGIRLNLLSVLKVLKTTFASLRTSKYFLWDGNRQVQEYTDEQIFTTVYEQGSFEPVANLT